MTPSWNDKKIVCSEKHEILPQEKKFAKKPI